MRQTPGRGRRFVAVPLDGSPAAATALPVAVAIARQLGARVWAVHLGSGASPGSEPWRAFGLQAPPDPDVELHPEAGEPVEGILRIAADPAVILVVMSTRGHAVGAESMLAPTARQVAAAAPEPILFTRPEVVVSGWRPLKRLLIPLDGTPSTAAALKPAMGLLGTLTASIDLLHVFYPFQPPGERGSMALPSYVDQPQYEWPAWRGKVAEWLRCNCEDVPDDAVLDVYLARGRDADAIGPAIVTFAEAHADDVIVVVRRSGLDPGRAQVLSHVLDRSPCPVLVVPGPLREAAPRRDTRR